MQPGQGVAWIGRFVDGVLATRPPMGLVIAPDLTGAAEAVAAAATRSERPVVSVLALPSEAGSPLAAVRSILPDADTEDPARVPEQLVRAFAGSVVVVDEAHWMDEASIAALAGLAARGGVHDVGLLVAHRPGSSELAVLDDALAERGPVERPDGLDDDELAARLASRTGRPAGPTLVALVRELTSGRLGLVDLLVDGWVAADRLDAVAAGGPGDAVAGGPAGFDDVIGEAPRAALRLRIDRLSPPARHLLGIRALVPSAGDDVVASVVELPLDELVLAARELGACGLLAPGAEHPPVVVARAALAALDPAERRLLDRRVGEALSEQYGSAQAAAEHLAAAAASGPEAAAVYVAAGRDAERTDPAAALAWYRRAAAAGADPLPVRAALAELQAVVGERVGALGVADEVLAAASAAPGDRARAARAGAAVSYRAGHTRRALAFLAASEDDPWVVAIRSALECGAGRRVAGSPSGGAAADDLASSGVAALADAADAAVGADASTAVRRALDAAAMLAAAGSSVALPESPAVIGAVAAMVGGDLPAARRLLDDPAVAAVGGALHTENHRAWGAWLAMVAGEAGAGGPGPTAEGHGSGGSDGPTIAARDAVVLAAVEAGRARRSGDLNALHESWRRSEPLLIDVEPDLWLIEPAGELAAAAVRLDPHRRTSSWLEAIGAAVHAADASAAWRAVLAWGALQVGLAADDEDAVRASSEVLGALPGLAPPHEALRTAAAVWVEVLAGTVDPDRIDEAARALDQAGRRWDASRLVGQAAVRTTDPAVARSLLGRARELAPATGEAAAGRAGGASDVLSDREIEISRLVLEGRTHKEIGAQLFLSPKTVEHHVARIRTKLGASTRAEMLAALRRELGDP